MPHKVQTFSLFLSKQSVQLNISNKFPNRKDVCLLDRTLYRVKTPRILHQNHTSGLVLTLVLQLDGPAQKLFTQKRFILCFSLREPGTLSVCWQHGEGWVWFCALETRGDCGRLRDGLCGNQSGSQCDAPGLRVSRIDVSAPGHSCALFHPGPNIFLQLTRS